MGGALAASLAESGWHVSSPLGRNDDLGGAAQGVDLVIITVNDPAIARVASLIEPSPTTVVAHVAGSLGLDVLGDHPLRAAFHPLVSVPDVEHGRDRLLDEAWFALAASDDRSMAMVISLVASLGGHSFVIADENRASYHAAAAVVSNHLVALLAQGQRIAQQSGAPFEAFLQLIRSTLDNVEEVGPAAALTGPVARGDWATVDRHREAIDPSERELYDALVIASRRLVDERTLGDDGSSPRKGSDS